MGHIYSSAAEVLVWLGPDINRETWLGCQIVQDFAPRLTKAFEERGPKCMDDCVGKTGFWMQEFGRHEFNKVEVNALNHLYARKWFQRLWVVQEVVLAKRANVVCGSSCFNWFHFESMALFLTSSGYSTVWSDRRIRLLGMEYVPPLAASVMVMGTLKSRFDYGRIPISEHDTLPEVSQMDTGMIIMAFFRALEFLIACSRSFQATMPQDKVFAPAALLLHKFSGRITDETFRIDYSVPVRTLYVDTCTKIINNGKRLSLLNFVEDLALRQLDGLPSWVPDFGSMLSWPLINLRGLKGQRFKGLSGGPDCAPSASGGRLKALGRQLDDISGLMSSSHRPDGFTGGGTFVDAPTLWLEFALSLGTSYLTGEPAIEAFIRTIVADQVGNSDSTALRRLFRNYALISLLRSNELDAIFKSYSQQTGIADRGSLVSSLLRMVSLNPDNCPSWPVLKAFEDQYGASVVPAFAELLECELNIQSGANSDILATKDAYLSTDSRHLRCLMGRRLFRSRQGYIGLSPKSAIEGDEIWLLPGSDVPLILRPAEQHSAYVLVGSAYVHGIMYGELNVQQLGDLVSLTIV